MLSLVFSLILSVSWFGQAVQFTPQNNVKQWPDTRSFELFDYVARVDPSFEYYDTGVVLNQDRLWGAWRGHLLNVTSQTWRTTKEVSLSKWTHTLAVIVPDHLTITDQALIYLTGGDNVPEDRIEESREDILLVSTIAVKTGSITAAMFQVPNQPIVFVADPLQKNRHEDAFVGFTWFEFFKNTSRPELLGLLPMTKAGVRGMDVIQHFCVSKEIANPKQFVVAGASKRGWTTWLVGAVDQRVKAIIPVVMDLLYMQKSLVHHYRSLGGWSFAFQDYHDLELTRYINTPLMSRMQQVIDVATYTRFLDMPKLAIGSTGDEFFLLDDDQFWWGSLPGKTWRLMVPNAEHTLDTGIFTVVDSVAGFHNAILRDHPIPELDWSIKTVDMNATMNVRLTHRPSRVILRSATTQPKLTRDRKDFRLITNKDNCSFLVISGYCIQPILWSVQDLKLEHQFDITQTTDRGLYHAFLVEMTFPSQTPGLEFVFTTQAVIVPQTYPYPAPLDGELGVLV